MTSPRQRTSIRSHIAGTCLAIVLIGTLSVCGSTADGGDDVASLGSVTASTETGETTPTSIDPQDAFVEYTRCMRDEGIDLPDPKIVTADGASGGAVGGQAIEINDGSVPNDGPNADFDSDEFQAAEKKCKPILDDAIGDIQIDPEVAAEQREQMLAFAKCMREHGVDFPDPVFGENGSVTVGLDGPTGSAPAFDSDEFKAATEACGEVGGFMTATRDANS